MSDVNMYFVPYQGGRIACIEGKICRIEGLMVGSVVHENIGGSYVPRSVTYRIPLKGAEHVPVCTISSKDATRFSLIISAVADKVTPDELFRMMDSVQYCQKIDNPADALRMTVKALEEAGASGYLPGSPFFELDFDSDDTGLFYIGGYRIRKNELLVVLSDIQRFTGGTVLLCPERDLDELSVIADKLQMYMNEMYNKGLWRGEADGKDCFFVGEWMFKDDWMTPTRITLDEFKAFYNDVSCIIHPGRKIQ